jgi:dinuclear metal center YbgI/SA1388 family protein
MKIKDITAILEEFAPLPYQEDYDNAGLIIGDPNKEIYSALLCIDVTDAVITEAIKKGVQLIISHHPIIFGGLKKINGKNIVERCVIKAIKNDIALYACHTNIDSVYDGVNAKICEKLNIKNTKILQPLKNQLKKLVTFVPIDHIDKVRNAIFDVGAGQIGEYDSCSYNIEGTGTFRASENTDPFVGEKGEFHREKEIRFETIFPKNIQSKVLNALFGAHPYEEVAYDIYPLENVYNKVGMGMIGVLENSIEPTKFFDEIKKVFNVKHIKHTELCKDKIKKVAVCGGSGSFLLNKAKAAGADIFISGDFKYHQFFDADNKIIIADIGHFESEQFTLEIFYDLIIKKIPKFAVYLTEVNTNPINYY